MVVLPICLWVRHERACVRNVLVSQSECVCVSFVCLPFAICVSFVCCVMCFVFAPLKAEMVFFRNKRLFVNVHDRKQ